METFKVNTSYFIHKLFHFIREVISSVGVINRAVRHSHSENYYIFFNINCYVCFYMKITVFNVRPVLNSLNYIKNYLPFIIFLAPFSSLFIIFFLTIGIGIEEFSIFCCGQLVLLLATKSNMGIIMLVIMVVLR